MNTDPFSLHFRRERVARQFLLCSDSEPRCSRKCCWFITTTVSWETCWHVNELPMPNRSSVVEFDQLPMKYNVWSTPRPREIIFGDTELILPLDRVTKPIGKLNKIRQFTAKMSGSGGCSRLLTFAIKTLYDSLTILNIQMSSTTVLDEA